MSNKIYMFKMNNGEVFFGLLSNEDDNYYYVQEPKAPMQVPNQQTNQMEIHWVKWLPYQYNDREIKINKNHVVCVVEEDNIESKILNDLKKEYFNITIPDNNVIQMVKN